MSYLGKLLEGAIVEWKPLGEITNVLRGRRLTRNQLSDENSYPVFHGGLEPLGYYDQSNRPANTVMIINVGASAGTVGYSSVDFWSSDGCYCIEHTSNINNRFLYHFFIGCQHFLRSKVRVAGIPTLDAYIVEKIKIPIPCPDNPKKSLEMQHKIAEILDAFTELTAELTAELSAELTARRQQYIYYREQLFCFDNKKVQHLSMGDESVGKFIRGGGLQKKDFTETGVGCIHYGQIYTYYGTYTDKTKSFVSEEFAKKARMAKYGDLVIATTSENDEDVCKAVAWLGDKEIAISSDACFYRHNLNAKYVAYFFQTEQFQKQKKPFITGTKVRRVNADDLVKIKIPVPSKKEQERIVSILDKFDTLNTSISEGLPKEIELRQKQYEYYRDLLLKFPKDSIEA